MELAFDAAIAYPFRELSDSSGELGGVVENDESLNSGTLGDETHVGSQTRGLSICKVELERASNSD